MSGGCAFCKIVADAPTWAVPYGRDALVFKPFGAVHPQHRLFIPKRHIETADEEPGVTGLLFSLAAEWAAGQGKPFNLVVNSGAEAGQSVSHLHVHYVPRLADDGLGYRWEV